MNPRVMAEAVSAAPFTDAPTSSQKSNQINDLGPKVQAPAGPVRVFPYGPRGSGRAGGDRSQ